MPRSAHVKSVDAVRDFRKDMIEFQTALRHTLEILMKEVSRGIQWLESDRAAYWPAQVRRASDRVSEARISLERCQLATRSDERRSCYDEKKAFDRAKKRLAYAEQKVRATRHWLRVVRHEAEEFQSRLARLGHMAEHELPQGIALLDRLARSLDRYAEQLTSPRGPNDQSEASQTHPTAVEDLPEGAPHRVDESQEP